MPHPPIGSIANHAIEDELPLNLPRDIVERAEAMRNRLDAIRNAPIAADENIPDLTAKQLERAQAFQRWWNRGACPSDP